MFAVQLGCRSPDKPVPSGRTATPAPLNNVPTQPAAAKPPIRVSLKQWLLDVGTPALARTSAKLEMAEILPTHLAGEIDVVLRTVMAMEQDSDDEHEAHATGVVSNRQDLSMAIKIHTKHDGFRANLASTLEAVFGAPTTVVSAIGLPTLQYRSGANLLQLEILDSHTWLLKAAPTFANENDLYIPLWPVPAQADCATVGKKPQLLGVGARIPLGTSEAAVSQRLRNIAADADERGTVNAGIDDETEEPIAGSRLRWQFAREGVSKLEYTLHDATRWRLLHCWHEAARPAPTWADDKARLTYSLHGKTLTIQRFRPLATVFTTLANLAQRARKPKEATLPSPTHTETGDVFFLADDHGVRVEGEHNHNLARQLDAMIATWGDPHTQRDNQGRPQLVFKSDTLTITLFENDDGTHYTMELNGPTQ